MGRIYSCLLEFSEIFARVDVWKEGLPQMFVDAVVAEAERRWEGLRRVKLHQLVLRRLQWVIFPRIRERRDDIRVYLLAIRTTIDSDMALSFEISEALSV